MTAFRTLWNEVREAIPGEALSPFLAQRLVNRALGDIYRARNWSFLIETGFFQCPAAVSSGVVTATRFSRTVTGDATAQTAWNAMGLDIPITERVLRVGGGPAYRISAYDGAGTLTLESAYQEADTSGSTYEIYRAYHRPPSTDFYRLASVVDRDQDLPLRLHATREELDARDPERTESGSPECVATFKVDSSGCPLFEIHPHVRVAKSFPVTYLKKGAALTNDSDEPPPAVPDEVVISRALYLACLFAQGQKGLKAELKGVDWLGLSLVHDKNYKEALQRAKLRDEETYPQNVVTKPQGFARSDEWLRTHVTIQ